MWRATTARAIWNTLVARVRPARQAPAVRVAIPLERGNAMQGRLPAGALPGQQAPPRPPGGALVSPKVVYRVRVVRFAALLTGAAGTAGSGR